MGFVDAVKSAYGNYANFKGRASRSEYWWFQLFFMVVYFGVMILAGVLSAFMGEAILSIMSIVIMVFALGSILPSIALAARRMHDSDKSGWFMLVPIYSLYLAIIKGTDGPNRFGPDPVGPNVDTFN